MKKARYTNATMTIASIAALLMAPAANAAWDEVVIPDLPPNTHLHRVWTRERSEVYVWGYQSSAGVVNSQLYRFYSNRWSVVLSVRGEEPAAVFGVSSNEVYAATAKRMWRSTDNGDFWAPQSLPFSGDVELARISGTLNNVHATAKNGSMSYMIHFDGNSWNHIFTSASHTPYALRVLSPDEAYFVSCWGFGAWTRSNRNYIFTDQGFSFCDVYDMYAVRGSDGKLNWWAVGNNNFANGIRIWRFNNQAWTFGSSSQVEFKDGDGFDIGSATAIWGSSERDVYVVGNLAAVNGGTRSGRVYHYDGTKWSRLMEVGDIMPESVWGSSKDNVWISGRQGKLLRLREWPQPQLSIQVYAGIEITGGVGATYEIQFASTADATEWQVLGQVTTDASPYLYVDRSSPGATQRFYRAVRK